MIKKYLVPLVASMAVVAFPLKAEDVTHIVVSGQSGERQYFDLSAHNRITFSNTSMRLSSSDDSGQPAVDLSYSMFNRIEFTENVLSGIEETIFANAELVYSPTEKTLTVRAEVPEEFTVRVFNSSGMLVCQSKIRNGESVTLGMLQPGFYIGLADSNGIQFKTKFIIR